MLDREGPVPVYRQIADILHRKIKNGELRPGDPIPSEAALEAAYEIARTTARRVARELRDRGVAHTVRGEGTFVGPPGHPRAADRVPVYERIADELTGRIKHGELSPLRPIPSEKTLIQQYGVAKATVRQAVKLLRERGWVFTVAYRGTYVRERNEWPDNA
ncbi:GntR family transcriptional regulator [Thermoactinospora rubra]|uniref:GntR family transcriptional regulator n=1 Tax=Thermoactinospora rubra TaxID=1088767 RepID=UPI000A119242|nr:winged helix-turn-helix domain-containing protein [Thermoactinospora rubra]